jgi:hypothetical protein
LIACESDSDTGGKNIMSSTTTSDDKYYHLAKPDLAQTVKNPFVSENNYPQSPAK